VTEVTSLSHKEITMNDLPLYSEELIKQLDAMFPHRCPTIDMSMEKIQRYAGTRDLIDMLLTKLNSQQSRQDKEKMNVPIPRNP